MGVGLLGCSQQVDFGTLPAVQVTYEADPSPPEEPKTVEEEEAPPIEHDLPDPEAIRSAQQVRFTLAFEQGDVSLVSHERVTLKQPVLTARRVGRFAAELWLGRELLERVRFDFPLLGAESDDESLERGLSTQTVVQLPNIEEATRLRILDRKTRAKLDFSWPLSAKNTPLNPVLEPSGAPPAEDGPVEAPAEVE